MTIRLAFGTAGIRAPLGEGLDRINVHTVAGVVHALCSELTESFPNALERGVCVAWDGRTDSELLARRAIEVALSHGLLVRAFTQPTPTPLLAFATRMHGAVAGVMITASHNPPSDNGIKLYLERGAQVLPPYDEAIARRMASFEPAQLPAASSRQPEPLGEREARAYLKRVASLAERSPASTPRFAYSALCGVGGALTERLLARQRVSEFVQVEEQAEPRADFGGLRSPNPEHAEALAALVALTEKEQLALAFAHDPDADRLAVLSRNRAGELRALSGDEVGALLGDFLLARDEHPSQCVLVSTLVSGGMLESIARSYRARFERTATGFKWITARGRELEREEQLHFLFGYEEAIGYAFGAIAEDKDGIAALHVTLALARLLHDRKLTLCDQLDLLAKTHGRHATRQLSLPRSAEGEDPMAQLRAMEPAELLGPGATRVDHAVQERPSELLVFTRGTSRVCVRPSGTEPKLKLYLHVQSEVHGDDLARADAANQAELDELEGALKRALSRATT